MILFALTGFTFPRDHGPHEDTANEWWYFSGVLNDDGGTTYSYCYIVFRFPRTGIWVFNMTNLETGEPVFGGVEIYPLTARNKALLDTLDLTIENRYLRYAGKDSFAFGFDEPAFSLDLLAFGLKPPVLHGDDGYVVVGEYDTSAYYSFTRMAAKGKMVLRNETKILWGDAWMDHQWGRWDAGKRYDWFSFRFEDGTEMMLYRFRDEEGNPVEQYQLGTYIDEKGNRLVFKDFQADPLGHFWIVTDSSGKYPLRWRVRVPSLGIDVTIDATTEDQFFWLDKRHLVWEGVCRITSGNKKGYCFLEMVGY